MVYSQLGTRPFSRLSIVNSSWVHVRSADCPLSIPAGYTSVQQTGIVDAVEERSQVRFTPSQSNTGVAIAVETVGVAFVGVFVFKKRADLDDSGNY